MGWSAGSKVAKVVIIGLVISIGAVSAFATTSLASNILEFGPASLFGITNDVEFVKVTDLPEIPLRNQEYELIAKATALKEVHDLNVIVLIESTSPLKSADVVTFKYKDSVIQMHSAGDKLSGVLINGLKMRAQSTQDILMKVTFNEEAPNGVYKLKLWAEQVESRHFTIGVESDISTFGHKWVGIDGVNADGSSIAGELNPMLKVNKGEQVTITFKRISGAHNAVIWDHDGNGVTWINMITYESVDLTFTAPTEATTWIYQCTIHPWAVVGKIIVS
ncbi:MAG: hypothetical protein ACE5J2_07110 [Nitrososphaerales archaeon]